MLERNIKKYTKLKARSFLILLLLIALATLLIWLFNSPQPHLRSIVSKTHMHIKNINSKFQALNADAADGNSGEDETAKSNLEIDSTYLELLGFVSQPRLYKEDGMTSDNAHLNKHGKPGAVIPPIVTAFFRFGNFIKMLLALALDRSNSV
jgi:hypothetical protein